MRTHITSIYISITDKLISHDTKCIIIKWYSALLLNLLVDPNSLKNVNMTSIMYDINHDDQQMLIARTEFAW